MTDDEINKAARALFRSAKCEDVFKIIEEAFHLVANLCEDLVDENGEDGSIEARDLYDALGVYRVWLESARDPSEEIDNDEHRLSASELGVSTSSFARAAGPVINAMRFQYSGDRG